MTQSPLLTICIPTFNRAGTLKSCLFMLCSQIEQRDEVIDVVVCDNASEDATRQVVVELQEKWPFIKYFRNDQNIGMLRNIDRALRHADGQLCWLFGDDDITLPYALEKILDTVARIPSLESFAFGCTNSFVVDPDGNRFTSTSDLHCKLETTVFENGGEIFKHLDYHSVGHISRLIVNRKAWIEWDYDDRKEFEVFSFVRVLIRMTKGRSTFYLEAPIVGGRNKHSVAYYANHLALAFCVEFPEYDRLCIDELGLSFKEMLPMMKARRHRILKGAIKMLVFQKEYRPYLKYLRWNNFSLLSEKFLVVACRWLMLNRGWVKYLRGYVERRQTNPISKDTSINKSV